MFVDTFLHCIGGRNIAENVLLSFFISFSFYFLNALQSDNNSNTVCVLGHKYVCIKPCLMAWAKVSLSRAQNIFMPTNMNSVVLKNTNMSVGIPFVC